ncbi:hypothetical protein ACJ41P_10350 [Azospirillum argentinense]|uniref:Uncharacterized protein n=1 Tax=Azospirillum argentinense TaxID=2970906 RepID=A0ABW8V8I1_9PROT
MTAKAEAIANANAHLNNAGLPTYDELRAALNAVVGAWDEYDPRSGKGGPSVSHSINAARAIASATGTEGA